MNYFFHILGWGLYVCGDTVKGRRRGRSVRDETDLCPRRRRRRRGWGCMEGWRNGLRRARERNGKERNAGYFVMHVLSVSFSVSLKNVSECQPAYYPTHGRTELFQNCTICSLSDMLALFYFGNNSTAHS